jgi:hypothetical protein
MDEQESLIRERISAEAIKAGHETADVNVVWLKRILWLLLLGAVLTHLITGGAFLVFRHWLGNARLSPAVRIPAPRLEIRHTKLSTLNRESEHLLHSYGWEDLSHGMVRIPIDRAMERMAHEPK